MDNAPVPTKDRIFYFYGDGLDQMILLDHSKYRGRGRPRKIDYSPFKEIEKRLNSYMNEYLNLRAKGKNKLK